MTMKLEQKHACTLRDRYEPGFNATLIYWLKNEPDGQHLYDEANCDKVYKVVRSLLGRDKAIVCPKTLGRSVFDNKKFSHVFTNLLTQKRDNNWYRILEYPETRICICDFSKPIFNEKEFCSIPSYLNLSQSAPKLKKDIKEFLERSPYA